jgi:hypothetical protein
MPYHEGRRAAERRDAECMDKTTAERRDLTKNEENGLPQQ